MNHEAKTKDLSSLREDYENTPLGDDAPKDPWILLEYWFEEAKNMSLPVNEMTLCTTSDKGEPSARIVLLKRLEPKEKAFWWFGDYESQKGVDLSNNPNACLLFYWPSFRRQIKVLGTAARLSEEDNLAYFNSRPLESKIAANISNQSQEIESQEKLHQRFLDFKESAEEPKKPERWGGHVLTAHTLEFWQGAPSRLHDRLSYKINALGEFTRSRLCP